MARNPLGPGTVRVKVTVDPEGFPGAENPAQLDLSLEWIPNDTGEQPDHWSIYWSHSIELIADWLREYLEAYCPVSREMFRTFLVILPPEMRVVFFAADSRSLQKTLDEERAEALGEMKRRAAEAEHSESAKELLERLKATVKV